MMSAVNKARPEFEVSIISDASGSWGCGALNGREWFQLKWAGHGSSREYHHRDSSSAMGFRMGR